MIQMWIGRRLTSKRLGAIPVFNAIVYDAILEARHKTSSNEHFSIFPPGSVLQSGQCHNEHYEQRFTRKDWYTL